MCNKIILSIKVFFSDSNYFLLFYSSPHLIYTFSYVPFYNYPFSCPRRGKSDMQARLMALVFVLFSFLLLRHLCNLMSAFHRQKRFFSASHSARFFLDLHPINELFSTCGGRWNADRLVETTLGRNTGRNAGRKNSVGRNSITCSFTVL